MARNLRTLFSSTLAKALIAGFTAFSLAACNLKIKTDEIIPTVSTPVLTLSDAASTEGTDLNFAVAIRPAPSKDIVLRWKTLPTAGSAVDGVNYESQDVTTTIAAGSSMVLLSVPTYDTSFYGDPLTVTLALLSATNAAIGISASGSGMGQARGVIRPSVAAPTLSIAGSTVSEGSPLSFTVTQSRATGVNTLFNYTTSNGTAIAGTNYSARSGTLTILAGQTTSVFTVPTLVDGKYGNSSQMTVTLSAPVHATLAAPSANGVINNSDAPPTLSLASATAAEGSNLVFTVTQSAPSLLNSTFTFATTNGTAIAGVNYTAKSVVASITAGQTATTVAVATQGDGFYGSSLSMTANISGPSNATLSTSSAVGTITNTDAQPNLSIAAASANEGSALSFTVSLSKASLANTVFQYSSANGTALAGTNYSAQSGTLTIAAGNTSTVISVPTLGDSTYSLPLTMTLNLSGASGAAISVGAASGTINNTDGAPSISVAAASASEGSNLVFTITQSATSLARTTFVFSTNNNTAIAPTNYITTTGTATIGVGATTTTVIVPTSGDGKYSAPLTMSLGLSAPVNATIAAASAVGTINNTNAAPTISIASSSANEGSNLRFTVTQSAVSLVNTTFNFATADGTAASATNYTAASGTATIFAGDNSTVLVVNTLGDGANTSNLTMTVSLSGAANATLATSQNTGTIINTDGQMLVSIADSSANEGSNLVFTVTQGSATGANTTVSYATGGGTGVAGVNYTAASGVATIAAGQTSTTFTVATLNDSVYSNALTVLVTLANPSAGILGMATAVGTINNLQAQPTIAIAAASASEGSPVNFVVTQSAVSGVSTTFSYATSDGSAISSTNYSASSGVGTLAAGATSTTVSVNSLSDGKYSPSLTFTMTLSSPQNASITTSSAIGTINNTDSQPSLSVAASSANEGANLTFTVTQSAVSAVQTTFSYATSSGSAIAATNFTAASGLATIAAGATNTTLTVATLSDNKYTANLTFTISLSSPINATLSTASQLGTVVNTDAAPTLSIAPSSASEGSNVVFTVTQSSLSAFNTTFSYSTTNGSALAGTNYTASSGTATITAGQTTTTLAVPTLADSTYNPTLSFTISLANPTSASLSGSSSATGSITNLDAQPSIIISDASVNEGSTARFTVLLSNPSYQNVTLTYASSDGSAVAGTNYTAASGTLTIAAGQSSGTISVQTLADSIYKGTLSYTITLSSPTNATLVDDIGNGTILNTDAAPTVSFTAASQSTQKSLAATVSMVLQLSAVSGMTTTIPYTVSGTAVSGTDYNISPASPVTIAAGASSTTISVSVLNNGASGADTTLTVTLGTPSGANLGATQTQVLTIVNDLNLGSFTITGLTGNTDVTADAYLNSTLVPTVNWTASVGASSYDVTILDAAGTTTICATQNSASTSQQMAGCTLSSGTNYKAKVVAKNGSGSYSSPASNSAYSFLVNTAPSVGSLSPYYVFQNSAATLTILTAGSPAASCGGSTVGCTLSIVSANSGTNGTTSNTASTVTYTPNSNYTGSDSFTYTLSDGRGGTATGTVQMKVVTAYTWTGGGSDSRFDTAANWCGSLNASRTGCVGSASYPSSTSNTSHIAIFDETCSGANCSATIGSGNSMYAMKISSGYTSTITQNSGSGQYINVGAGGWTQASGTFVSNIGDTYNGILIANGGSLILTGGSFKAPTGTLALTNTGNAASSYSSTILQIGAGASWNANGGTLSIVSQAPACNTVTLYLDVPNNTNFKNMILHTPVNCGGRATFTLSTATNINILGDLTLGTATNYVALGGGTFSLAGATSNYINQYVSTGGQGTATIVFNGSGNQTYTANGDLTRAYPAIQINKSSGTVSAANNATDFSVAGFTLSQGTFNAPSSATMQITNSNVVDTMVFSAAAGTTFNAGSGTIAIAGNRTANPAANYSLDIPSGFSVNNLVLTSRSTGGVTSKPNYSLGSSQSLRVTGTLSVVSGAGTLNGASATIEAQGNVDLSNLGSSGSMNLLFSGTNNQSVWGSATNYLTGVTTVNKASGYITLYSSYTVATLTNLLGDIWITGAYTFKVTSCTLNGSVIHNSGGSAIFKIGATTKSYGTVCSSPNGTYQLN